MKRLASSSDSSHEGIPLVDGAMEEVPPPGTRSPRRAAPKRRGSSVFTWLGSLLLVAGLGVLGWVGYEVLWNPLVDPVQSSAAITELRAEWEDEESTEFKPIPGAAMGLLRIPAFGESFEQPILVGTSDATLARGMGWYEGTAKPGEIGNFAFAGHRGSRGPLAPMPTLHAGDEVIIETREAVFTYTVTNEPGNTMVMNTDTWVLDPVPGSPGVKPTEALITITTCHDLFNSPRRMILFGTLKDIVKK